LNYLKNPKIIEKEAKKISIEEEMKMLQKE